MKISSLYMTKFLFHWYLPCSLCNCWSVSNDNWLCYNTTKHNYYKILYTPSNWLEPGTNAWLIIWVLLFQWDKKRPKSFPATMPLPPSACVDVIGFNYRLSSVGSNWPVSHSFMHRNWQKLHQNFCACLNLFVIGFMMNITESWHYKETTNLWIRSMEFCHCLH